MDIGSGFEARQRSKRRVKFLTPFISIATHPQNRLSDFNEFQGCHETQVQSIFQFQVT